MFLATVAHRHPSGIRSYSCSMQPSRAPNSNSQNAQVLPDACLTFRAVLVNFDVVNHEGSSGSSRVPLLRSAVSDHKDTAIAAS